MSFLSDNWEKIQPPKKEMGVHPSRKAEGYIMPWNHDMANMHMICKAIEILKPKDVLELGTFEALGTEVMAKELGKHNTDIVFFTIDAGKPIECAGESAMTSTFADVENDERYKYWSNVEKIREQRVNAEYLNVNLTYVEGYTYDVLPEILEELGSWDFCFQDSVHLPHLNIKEWELLMPYANIGSVIVFDDIILGHGFLDWFPENNPDWDWRHTTNGRSQLWAEKVK